MFGVSLGIMDAGGAGGAGGSFESIFTVTLGTNSTTINFNSIPSTYKHLQLRCLTKSTITSLYGSEILFRCNGATTNSFTRHALIGNGSSVNATGGANQDGVYVYKSVMDDDSTQTNMYGTAIIDVHDYASTTKNKTIRAFAGIDGNVANTYYGLALSSGAYLSTTAITSIEIVMTGGGTYKAGSSVALYGIKG